MVTSLPGLHVTFDKSGGASRIKGTTFTLAGDIVVKAWVARSRSRSTRPGDRHRQNPQRREKKSAKVEVAFRGGKDLSFDIDQKIVNSVASQGKVLTLALDRGVAEVKLGEKDRRIVPASTRPRPMPC